MIKKATVLFLGMLGLAFGYLWAVGGFSSIPTQVAYAATMPATPNIIYLGAPESLTPEISAMMRKNNMELGGSWRNFAQDQLARPLDALIFDNSALQEMNAEDHHWLRGRLEDGVIVVGIGVNLEKFANSLDLDSFYFPGNARVSLEPQEYMIFTGFLAGTAEDVAVLRANNWLERSLKGEDTSIPGIKFPAIMSQGQQFGSFNDADGFGRFQRSLTEFIDGTYQDRADNAKAIANFPKR